MNTYYKCRIDTHDQKEVFDFVKKIDRYIIAFENNTDGTNPHVHYYIETDFKRDTLVKRIKKMKNYSPGNGFYSLRELTPDEDGYTKYLAYIIKDNDIQTKGFTSEELQTIRERNDLVVQEMKERKQKRKTVLQQIVEKYDYDNKPPTHFKPYRIISEVVSYYIEEEKLVREFLIVSQVQTILLKYSKEYEYLFRQQIQEKVLGKYQYELGNIDESVFDNMIKNLKK